MYLFLSLLQARVGSSLVSHLGNLAPEAVLRTPVAELAGRAKISERASRAFEELQKAFDPGLMQERLAAKGIETFTPVDEAYPGPLRSIPDPPPAVFVNGVVPETVSVALVGSRKASTTGIETARALGLALSERGADNSPARPRRRTRCMGRARPARRARVQGLERAARRRRRRTVGHT